MEMRRPAILRELEVIVSYNIRNFLNGCKICFSVQTRHALFYPKQADRTVLDNVSMALAK